ncbi:MAG TPA: peptide chain release factor N(5)-glutamine methyltransferase [Anaerolineae bacterium]|nr:peptide chain release factor N(5)-glutamine methyltransferase [Anaerolineae bacterium]HID84298.1 peptide chain release factor N(5)-glutamine methyltransferase [Anaerolineales bacterium]
MPQPQTLSHALNLARGVLAPHSDTAAIDAQTLLAHLTGRSRAWVLAHPEALLDESQTVRLHQALQRLARGEPLPYVLGQWEFFGRSFVVTPAVLIPRPETELLVEAALDWLRAHPGSRRVVDVGTGSGCIAVSLAAEVDEVQIVAIDQSAAALEVARRNAQRHGVTRRLRWIQADLLAPFAGPWDVVCANLPYIPSAQLARLPVARFEPRLALDGGPDGLHLVRRLLRQARVQIASPGALFLEIGAGQGPLAAQTARRLFPEAYVEVRPDLAGHPRLLCLFLT